MYYLLKYKQGNGAACPENRCSHEVEEVFNIKEELLQFLTDFEVRRKIAEIKYDCYGMDVEILDILEVNQRGLDNDLTYDILEVEKRVGEFQDRYYDEKEAKELEEQKKLYEKLKNKYQDNRNEPVLERPKFWYEECEGPFPNGGRDLEKNPHWSDM